LFFLYKRHINEIMGRGFCQENFKHAGGLPNKFRHPTLRLAYTPSARKKASTFPSCAYSSHEMRGKYSVVFFEDAMVGYER
jgi:hypothetical protein